MVFPKVLLQRVVIDVILLLSSAVPAIAEVTSLMLVSTMHVEFIIAVEALTAEAAFGMTFESTLVYSSRIIVAKLFVFLQLGYGKQLMLVGEDFLIPGTEIAHDLVVGSLDVAMEVRPAPASDLTAKVWAVVPQQQDGVVVDFLLLVLDPKDLVHSLEVGVDEFFVSLCRIVCKHDMLGFRLISLSVCCIGARIEWKDNPYPAVSACSRFIQSSESQSANVAGAVIAWCY